MSFIFEIEQADGSKQPINVPCPGWVTGDAWGIPGWFRADELASIVNAATTLGPTGQYVELGTWCGRSASLVADCLPAWRVTTIDSYPAGYCSEWADGDPILRIESPWDVAEANFRERTNITAIRRKSYHPPDTAQNVRILLVDAGHTEADVYRDVVAWLPRMARKSFIFLHDAEDIRFKAGIQAGAERAFDGGDWKRNAAHEVGTLNVWSR